MALENRRSSTGSILQNAGGPQLFENLLGQINNSTVPNSVTSGTDGPHPITAVSEETITLHYGADNENSLGTHVDSFSALFDDYGIPKGLSK